MQNLKKTAELDFELEKSEDINSYLQANAAEFNNKRFYGFLSELIDGHGKPKSEVAANAFISEPYLYDLLRGTKKPSRNTVFKLAFSLAANIETTERLLFMAGHGGFYVRNKRDALLKFSFLNSLPLQEADALLSEHGFSVLTE